MSAAPTTSLANPAIDRYQLRLPMFEGPLDVLLRLIERHQLEITEVSLVEVTDQFLDYVTTLPETDPVLLAEFAAIASRLLVLKSRSLLPAPPVEDEQPETDDLTHQLIAYKAIRDGASMLADRQTSGHQAFRRPPGIDDWGATSESLLLTPVRSLITALKRCQQRRLPKPTTFRPRAMISLADMAQRIVHRLRRGGRTRFSSLVSPQADRHEVVAGFVAVLNLWKKRSIRVWQPEAFGEIEVEPTGAQWQAADD